ncbi:uncharacterized protein LOC127283812 [Leptopilina boulardi]|uniref:uncharacterized protein LOC127283812 n=1 Tax=Leptopilina boulardi TaxID=63433 RepID=UPI0021F5972C|nr:uncharacterized protein LOC127283812 [Leptopilina boulardi]
MDSIEAFNHIIKISKINLQLLGIWPNPYKSENLLTYCHVVLVIILIFIFVNIPQTTKLLMVRNDLDKMIEILCTADISVAVAIMMIFVLWRNKETLRPLVTVIIQDWMKPKSKEEHNIMVKMAQTSRRISIICLLLSQGTFHVKLIQELFSNINHKLNGNHNETRLLVESYFPYNMINTPNFEITWCIQWFALFLATCAYSGIDSFFAVLVMHISGQFAALQLRIINSVNVKNFKVNFKNIIHKHVTLYRHIEIIEDSFNIMFLAQMLACSIQFCLQGYQLISIVNDSKHERPIANLLFMAIFLIYMMGHFYIYCYLAEQLRFQTTEVANSAYKCEWFSLESIQAKNILFLMKRAKKPGVISAGKFCFLSLEIFNKIMKNSMGYLSVLLAMKRKQNNVTSRVPSMDGKKAEYYSMRICKLSLRIIGIWPEECDHNKDYIDKYRAIGIFILVILFINVSQTLKLFMVLNEIALFSEVLCKINLPVLVVLLMIVIFIRKKEELKSLVVAISDDWNNKKTEEERLIMWNMARLARKISIFCTFLSQGTVVGHTLSEISILINDRFQSPSGNFTYRSYLISYFPYDTKSSPIFELTWLSQFLATFLSTITYSGVHSFFAVLVMHLCGQFNILKIQITATINKITHERRINDFQKIYRQIIQRHQFLNRCVDITEDSFNVLFLAEIFACCIQFCLQGFQLVIMTRGNDEKLPIDSMIVMIMFLIYLLTFLFIYCYLAEQLRRQSAEIAYAAYSSKWYDLSSKEANNLLLLMQRGGIPSTLTAGKFCTLSLQLFNRILKTSAGYFSMLLTITRDNVLPQGPFEDLMKYSRMCLKTFGAWPSQTNKTLSNVLFFISFMILMFTIIIPQGIKLIQVRDNLRLITQIVCAAELPFLVAVIKMCILYYNKETIKILYGYIIDNWKTNRSNDEIKIMMKEGYRGKKIAIFCMSMGFATMIARLIQWIFENLSNWHNPDHFKNYTLYIEAYFPYNWNYSPIFELSCIIEFVGTYLSIVVYTGTDGFFSQIVLHLSGEYIILGLKLMDIINTKVGYEFDEKLGHIIDVHDHINSCIGILESTYNLMILVQLLGCSIQFCMQGFLFVLYVTDKNSSSVILDVLFIVVYLMYMIGDFYVYCYLGEQLQIQSFAFAQTAYDCEWYNLPPKKAKCLLLLMQSGHKPVQVTAGKFCVLNLILFQNIIKTSMGYLSFLVTMTIRKK